MILALAAALASEIPLPPEHPRKPGRDASSLAVLVDATVLGSDHDEEALGPRLGGLARVEYAWGRPELRGGLVLTGTALRVESVANDVAVGVGVTVQADKLVVPGAWELRVPMEVGLGIVPVTGSPDVRGGVGARLRGPAAPSRFLAEARVWGTLGFPTVNSCIGCQQPPSPIGWWTSLGVGMEFG